MQGREATKAVKPATEADHAEPAAVSTPPWMEKVAGSDRKPAKAAPTAVSEAEAKAAAPSKERYIRGRPERVVACVDRTRPPSPAAVYRHPAPVVIRRPSPRLVADPGPSVVRLIHPVAIAVRNPSLRLIRNPDLSVVGRILPFTVGVEILRSNVILVGVCCQAFEL